MPVGVIFKRILRCKLVYDVYEFYYLYFMKHAPSYLLPLLHIVEARLSRHADLVIPWWKTIAKFLRERYKIKNILIFPNIPPRDFFDVNTSNEKWRKKIEIEPDDFVVLYAGSLREHYKLKELLESCSILVYEYGVKNVKIMIAGSGPLLNALVEKAKNDKIEKYCRFLGPIPYEEISSLYHLSDIVYAMYEPVFDHLMLPSGKIFEAMICRKPVITCHLGEKKRLVEEARCGAIIRPDANEIAKSLLKFIKNEEMRVEMGLKGYNYLNENLSWEKYSKSFLSAYQECLSQLK